MSCNNRNLVNLIDGLMNDKNKSLNLEAQDDDKIATGGYGALA